MNAIASGNVKIYCGCEHDGPEPVAGLGALDVQDARVRRGLHDPTELYFCDGDACNTIRCWRCCREEIICYYCPGCLHEVPGPVALRDGFCCPRACMRCPRCESKLDVIGSDDQFDLACPRCLFTTLESALSFSAPNSLAKQMAHWNAAHRTDSHEQQFARAEARLHEQLALGHAQATRARPRGRLSDIEQLVTSLRDRLAHERGDKRSRLPHAAAPAGPNEGRPSLELEDVAADAERAREAALLEHVALADTPLAGPLAERLAPLPMKLRTKHLRKCRRCQQVLVQHDAKPSSAKCTLKYAAITVLPRVDTQRLRGSAATSAVDDKQSADLRVYELRFTNVLEAPLQITVSVPASLEANGATMACTILYPTLVVGCRRTEAPDIAQNSLAYGRGLDWTSTILTLSRGSVEEIACPLLVRCRMQGEGANSEFVFWAVATLL